MLQLSSKGFFVQNLNPTKERYTIQTVILKETKPSLIPDLDASNNETRSDVQARNCQLVKASDSSKQIYLTEWEVNKNVFVILKCDLKLCLTESLIYVDEQFTNELIAESTHSH